MTDLFINVQTCLHMKTCLSLKLMKYSKIISHTNCDKTSIKFSKSYQIYCCVQMHTIYSLSVLKRAGL